MHKLVVVLVAQAGVLLRLFQGLSCVVLFLCVNGSFGSTTVENSANLLVEFGLGSGSSRFLFLISFNLAVANLSWLVYVHFLKNPLPKQRLQALFDSVAFIFLFSGGVAFATSDYVQHCEQFNHSLFFNKRIKLLDCATMHTSIFFCFFTALLHCFSFLLTVARLVKEWYANQSSEKSIDSEFSSPKDDINFSFVDAGNENSPVAINSNASSIRRTRE